MFGLWLARKGEFSGQTHRAAVVEHSYRLAMAVAGALTWALRWLQGALGRGDELVMVARAES
jgi:hypothetical protein